MRPDAWSDTDLETLRRCFLTADPGDLAFMLGRSRLAITQQARKLGLRRPSPTRFQPGQRAWNQGMKGLQIGGVATRFQKGNAPHTTLPVGTLRVTRDGTLQKKIGTASGSNSARWRSVHELVWVAAHGPVPAGHIVVFKPGCATPDEAAITLDKVECLSFAENMARNTCQRYPKPVAQVIQLRGVLTRAINQHRKMPGRIPNERPADPEKDD